MDSRKTGPLVFSTYVAIRAAAVGGVAFLAIWLATRQLYATALVVCGIASLIAADLARAIARTDRLLEHFLDALTSGAYPTPSHKHAGFARLAAALDRISALLSAGRVEHEERIGYLQTLLDTVTVALIVVRPDGRVTLANSAARRLAGAQIDRLEDIPVIGAQVSQTLRDLPPGGRQIVSLTDGQQVLASTARFSVPGHEPERLVALQRVAGELDAVELKAWQDMVRVLSHEMMNSLTPISSLSESLDALINSDRAHGIRAGDSSDEIAGAIDAIKRRSLGLMNFVERYRKLAELPSPNTEVVRLADFFTAIDGLMSASFKSRGVSYESRVSPSDLSVVADPALLEHAIINFLRNAIDAVGNAPNPIVKLSCSVEDERVVIAVADNGCGLPETNPDQIFIPFFTTKPDGSGIGLSIVRQIALAHGGRVEAIRNHPKGAIFQLFLPL